jgi:chorismate synthase
VIRYLTAGESHGRAISVIVDGIPAGLEITHEEIDMELSRRQGGFGRGARMGIERDRAEIISGIRHGKTIGSPICILIPNRDWENWRTVMSVEPVEGISADELRVVRRPRPGHADLAGVLKFGHKDIRDVLERASARETAARVAVGAIAKALLRMFGIYVVGHVLRIGSVLADPPQDLLADPAKLKEVVDLSPVRCADPDAGERMVEEIRNAGEDGDTVGGIFEIRAYGVPPGLGSHVQWDKKLDARLAMALMSIQAIKGVEIGLGFASSALRGSQVHDEILPGDSGSPFGIRRPTNNAGGIEGGISNGETIIARAAMKPIPTLRIPLRSIDLSTGEPAEASFERSDICAVPAATVVGEAVVSIVIADAICEKFGGDSVEEMDANYRRYVEGVRERLRICMGSR